MKKFYLKQAGKLSVSVSAKNILYDKSDDITLRTSTPHKLQKPELKNLKDSLNTTASKNTKTPTPSKKQMLTRSKTNIVFPEKNRFMEEAFRSNDSNQDKNQKLLIIDETKIKTEGEDTLFSASIFEDEIGSAESKKNSGEEGRGWLFEDERKEEGKREIVREKKGETLFNGVVAKKKK